MMTSDNQISPPSFALKMQIANLIVDKFPKQQRWKEYPRKNSMKVPEGENFSQTKLGGEFWACGVIVRKIYWN